MNLSRCYRGSVGSKKSVSMDRESVENLSSRQRAHKFVSMDWRSCRECVDQEPKNLDEMRCYWDSIKKKPRNLNRSRSCWDAIEKAESTRKFLNESRIYRERRKKSLIERNLSRICRGAVELEEKEFLKEEKHKEINATSKLLNQRFNQHIKLSKHLSTY